MLRFVGTTVLVLANVTFVVWAACMSAELDYAGKEIIRRACEVVCVFIMAVLQAEIERTRMRRARITTAVVIAEAVLVLLIAAEPNLYLTRRNIKERP